MKVTALLVDDERKSLAILKNKLERLCPGISIIGETRDPKEALTLIEQLQPQLVFLDVAMPGMSGFDLLASTKSPSFEVIFVTAFDNYAIDAINHCAIGYLVKPVKNEDLIATVDKAILNIEEKTALIKNQLLIENLGVRTFQKKKIVIPTLEGMEFVKIKEIIRCEGEDGYTKIYFKARKSMLSSHSIGHFNSLLENHDFYLVHKSHLINLYHIEKYLNEGTVILSNNYKIPVSRNRRSDFLSKLK
ncbi:LytR/AlgR family response regulator transcription factor [Aequorivita capsosiphonis]|uniref:LytR/AlgR family response regulator transcription factor n=1 Tax=Aequorivita capsosiphonis TaxID=487317 RepID=UPI0003F61A59|nr:LytTR family DNA-binding domain-containing protein [Aequorivita capsosiphonis]